LTHLDTTFLVDLLRERRRGEEGPASRLLGRLADEALAVSVHVACELFAGAELADEPERERERVAALVNALQVVQPDDRFAPPYGELLAELRRRGSPVPTMDLLIATAARVHEAALVTRNARDFERIPGLDVIAY
jgi:predicted nucleic acid-binding protein